MNTNNVTVSTVGKVMAASAKLDTMRFVDNIDRVLARIGDEVVALYPDSDELEAAGVDVVALAKVVGRKVSAKRLGRWVEAGLDINLAVSALGHGLNSNSIQALVRMSADVDEANGVLANYVEAKEDEAHYASVEDRIFAALNLS